MTRFSIIVPVLNRAALVRRAVDSCLRQEGDFEVIVVDDGSTDDTPDAVASYADPRVRLVRHAVNRGVCAARNTGIGHATGGWCVMLDSDFELLPGALAGLAGRCDEAPAGVGNVATMCTWDHGPDTPLPPPAAEVTVLDYPGFLRFTAGLEVSEWFNCIRRGVFDVVRYPEARAYEGSFHLALARRFGFQISRDRFVRIYTDAPTRITVAPPAVAVRRMLRDAADSAADAEAVLRDHGAAFRAHAPALFASYTRLAVMHHLLAGERAAALRLVPRLLPALARSPMQLATVGLGLVGPRPLAWAKAHWTWARQQPPRSA